MARDGLELMHAERWKEAEELLAKAYGLVPAPTVALLDARALEKLGKLLEAKARYEQAETPPAGEASSAFREAADDAAKRLGALEPRIPKVTISIDGVDPSDGSLDVSLDGRVLARVDWMGPLVVDPGDHVFTASAAGRAGVESRVTLSEGESKDVALHFEVTPTPAQEPPSSPVPEKSAEPPGHAARTWGFVALSVGVVGVATGVTAGVLMLNAKSALDKECSSVCPSSAENDLSRFRTTRVVSGIGYGVGALGIGAGALLLILAPKHEAAEAKAGVRVVAGFERIDVEGSF